MHKYIFPVLQSAWTAVAQVMAALVVVTALVCAALYPTGWPAPLRHRLSSARFFRVCSSFFWMVVVVFTTVVYVFVPFFYPCLLWICYFESHIFSSKILYWSCCQLEVQILPVQSSKLIKTKWCTTKSYPFKLVYCLAVGKYSARWSGERSTPDKFTICCETMSADLTNLFELWEG